MFHAVVDGDIELAQEYGEVVENRLTAGSRWSSCHHRIGVTETSLGDGRSPATVPKTWHRIDSTHSAWAHWLEYQPFPAPAFHIEAGTRMGLDITYDLLAQPDLDDELAAVDPGCQFTGVRRHDVTYPFKQAALDLADLAGPGVNSIGAVNTLVFGPDNVVSGFNTDHSGLQRRWRERMGAETPGRVAIIGAGGVGRAAAFAFAGLGAEEIRVSDLDPGRAAKLVDDLVRSFPGTAVSRATQEAAVRAATGIFNGTPLGMHFSPGTPSRSTRSADSSGCSTRLHTGAHAIGAEGDGGWTVGLRRIGAFSRPGSRRFPSLHRDRPAQRQVATGVEVEMRALLSIN